LRYSRCHPGAVVEKLNSELDERFVNTPFCEGDFYGRYTKRFGSLLNRSTITAEFIRHPLVLAIADKVLGPWCDRFNLNLTQGIEIHPGAPAQFPHRDQGMWQGAKGEIQYLLNVMWPLNDFTAENGATRIWPGSHRLDVLDVPPMTSRSLLKWHQVLPWCSWALLCTARAQIKQRQSGVE
jgi:hypothetical protein